MTPVAGAGPDPARAAAPSRLALGDARATGCGAGVVDVAAGGDLDTVVTGLTLSSQRSLPGDLYAALPGSRVHGMDVRRPGAARPARWRC